MIPSGDGSARWSSTMGASSASRRSVHDLRERTSRLIRHRAKDLQPLSEAPLVPPERFHHLWDGRFHEAAQISDVPLKATVVWLPEEVKSTSHVPHLPEPDHHEERAQGAPCYRIAVLFKESNEGVAEIIEVLGLRVDANRRVIGLRHRDCAARREDSERLAEDRLSIRFVNVFEKPHDVHVVEGLLRPGQPASVTDAEINVGEAEAGKVSPCELDLSRFEVDARDLDPGERRPQHTEGAACGARYLQEALALAVVEIAHREEFVPVVGLLHQALLFLR